MLSVGDSAPPFEGVDQHGQRVALDDLLKEALVVLYFYPKDFTRVCTQQACLFRDLYEDLKAKNVAIVGVSLDGAASHARFSNEHGLPFSLLPDSDKKIAKAYGVLRLFGIFTKRVTYVVDRDRRIAGVFHHELSARKHLDDLEALLARRGAA
jgi:peroxiredoxin Q/BCP